MTDIQRVASSLVEAMKADGSIDLSPNAALALIKFLQTTDESVQALKSMNGKSVVHDMRKERFIGNSVWFDDTEELRKAEGE